jgi:hypothetical protein
MRRRLALPLASALLALVPAHSATAAPAVPADKPQLLSAWTQTSASSYDAWWAARQNQGAWSAYAFDWSTDYCSGAPDNPLGFPFQNSCARHDFGYRNYKAAGAFEANKARLDSAFHADLGRVCARYAGSTRASCDTLAWTYYQGAVIFGTPASTSGGSADAAPADGADGADGPAVSGPAVSGPASDGPAVSGPAGGGPAVSGPAVSGPAASGPAADSSRVSEPLPAG